LRVNHQIRVPQIRVIDDEGKMIGVMTPQEGLKIAEAKGLDLIEIAPDAKPPTCKIMDYGKYKYELKKKSQEARKNQTIIVVKEIQLRPRTDSHDLETKLRHCREFLEDGNKVKFNMRFKGREMAHMDLGQEMLLKIIERFKTEAVVEVPPKKEGRAIFLQLAPEPTWLKGIEKEKAKKAQVTEKTKETEATEQAQS
jgi:translation initiation factor IF-3